MANIAERYFSLTGRLSRVQYWRRSLGLLIGALVCLTAYMILSRKLFAGGIPIPVRVIGGLVIVVFWWSTLSIAVRRLHDRRKSGWWIVPFYILPQIVFSQMAALQATPYAIAIALTATFLSLWGLIEIGFFRGTQGPNRFGDDPLV